MNKLNVIMKGFTNTCASKESWKKCFVIQAFKILNIYAIMTFTKEHSKI
jgi:hypothetical protein